MLSSPSSDLGELAQLARDSRRILPCDARNYAGGLVVHDQFGGDFYRRFIEVRDVLDGSADTLTVRYVRMVKERFGLDFLLFFERNKSLAESILACIQELQAYEMLHAAVNIPCDATREAVEISQQVLATIAHPLGVEAIGIAAWDRLNPLLYQAWVLLQAETLNSAFLEKSR